MKISYKWLCEMMPGLEQIPAKEIANKLTLAGLEVEDIADLGQNLHGIVVGEVVKKEKHPGADKLSVCQVMADKEYQVVCGAPNVEAGQKYPFAMLGTVMPGGMQIKPVKLRGVESFGMLCSAKELEMSDEASGLLQLSSDLKTGQAISEALCLDDVILEVNVTPNRGDALSHWGVACDVSVLTGIEVDASKIFPPDVGVHLSKKMGRKPTLRITHRDQKACGRFTGSQIFGLKIAPSPAWLSKRLESLGIRSINNVVDATNYVMLLTGHPVHAYDSNKISEQEIVIDSIRSNMNFKTLDGIERELQVGDLIIGDAKRAVALAGIMGGENSEISSDTHDVILEVAFFQPDFIRRTAKRLGLNSESSYRFERFVNPESVFRAHEILRSMILFLAGGEGTEITDSYPVPFKFHSVDLPEQEIKRMLGIEVPSRDVIRILSGLNCEVNFKKGIFQVRVPIKRSDLTRPIDLIEEISRLYGLDKISMEMPKLTLRSPKETRSSILEKETKDFFVSQGFHETVHYSFADPQLLEKVMGPEDKEQWIRLKNPISEDLSVMRPSLLPQLIQAYAKNNLLTDKGLRLFELRHVYKRQQDAIRENPVLAGLYAGNPFGRNRFGLNRVSDFFDGKGLLQNFFERSHIKVRVLRYEKEPFHPGQSIVFTTKDQELAFFGALNPRILQRFKITNPIYYFEIRYDVYSSHHKEALIPYRSISSLPSVYRDMSLVVPSHVTCQNIMDVIDAERPKYLTQIELFDMYEGESLPQGKKSLAFSMSYQPDERNFTDEEVNRMHFLLVEGLKKRLGVELR